MRRLICVGDAGDPATWSGIPYHLFQTAKVTGFLDEPVPLDVSGLRVRRALWNLRLLLTTGSRGGYQYSRDCLSSLMRQLPDPVREGEILSHSPLFPLAEGVRGPLSFYIDATVVQLMRDCGDAEKVGGGLLREVFARERDQYRAAERVVCFSRWAARSVIEDCGIAPEKVFVVPGGANVADDCAPVRRTLDPEREPLRLGFVGKDWPRKNLAFVIAVAEDLNRRGVAAEVVAAGFDPEAGPRSPHLRSRGLLSKSRQMAAFVDLVQSCHFGCLFSSVEPFGLSNCEFLRLGVPVLARDVGGIRDTIPSGLGHLFPADCRPGDVADHLETLWRDPGIYDALAGRVFARYRESTWQRAVADFERIWQGRSSGPVAGIASDPAPRMAEAAVP